MKCTFLPQCETVKDLMTDLDLRVEQAIRLETISGTVIPLNDKIGEHHVSINLAYKEQGKTKHINLPAFVTENEQERILNILFPANVNITIWKENKETTINFLNYHIDKRTQTITENSGIADPNENSNVVIIPIDFTRTYDEYFPEAEALAIKYFEDGALFSKPAYIKYIWKEDYATADAPTKVFLIPGVVDKENPEKIVFESPRQIVELDAPDTHVAFSIQVSKPQTKVRLLMNDYYAPIVFPDTFFLYANGSRIISESSIDTQFGTKRWITFRDALKTGRKPAVYLKTPDTDRYYPASYIFTWNADKTDILDGKISIQYVKETDGVNYLCIDDMVFDKFGFGAYGPDEGAGSDLKHFIKRIALPG